MPIDIYWKTPIVVASEEHVLLDCLGGRWKLPGLLDKGTNDRFGDTIDAALARQVHPVRLLLSARSGEGELPPALRRLRGEDGYTYTIEPDGSVKLGHPFVEISRTDNSYTVKARANSRSELESSLLKWSRRTGVDLGAVLDDAFEFSTNVPRVEGSFLLDELVFRCIAKMACNLVASEACEIFLGSEFDEIRTFVRSGGDARHRVTVGDPLQLQYPQDRTDQLDHLILVRGNEAGDVEAAILLFGHIQFFVQIGRCDQLRGHAFSYRVDQVGRQDRVNHVEDLALQFSARSKCAIDEETKLKGFSDHLVQLYGKAVDVKTRNDILSGAGRIVDEYFARFPDTTAITPDNLGPLFNLIAEHFVRCNQRIRAYKATLPSDEPEES